MELVAAVAHLAARVFTPPHPARLPEGGSRDLWTALGSRQPEERALLAATLVALPDPAADLDLAVRTMELLLSVPAEHDRAERLLERLGPHVDAGARELWRLRLEVAEATEEERADADRWAEWLAPLRAVGDEGAASLATAARLAASHLIETVQEPGVEWLAPCLDGRRIVNLRPALRRRPALAEALGPILELVDEADRVESVPEVDEVEACVARAELADERGDVAGATALLEQGLARSGGRPDLCWALATRAELLQDAALATRLAGLEGADSLDPARLRRMAARELRGVTVVAPAPPERGWSDRVRDATHDAPDAPPPDVQTLAFLEHAGAAAAAAAGWLSRGDDESLLQAARLADRLDDASRARLLATLEARVPDDELVLASDDDARALASALWALSPPSDARGWLTLRLRAASPDAAARPAAVEAAPEQAEDPHGAANRLAAAADLMEAGRFDAAGTIVVSVLRKLDDEAQLPRLLTLLRSLLAMEVPPEGVVGTTERALLAEGPLGEALLAALREDPLAAFPLHAALHRAALDRRRPDLLRVRLLETWLGIWCATRTAPDAGSLHDLMHGDVALLPLAAARLGGAGDPVAAARDFLQRQPPLSTPAAGYGAALLELALD
ncbi:MAG: hypothetical protein H6744_18960 [Deltaproteobacteria bacterium]|nr:hypothetical protein [Deltaproteobacteria bacterium]MCB9788763.1 hypothetical protein [Deltaproteobacteria bacterium]